MSETGTHQWNPTASLTSLGLSVSLFLATVLTVGYWLVRGVGIADTEAMESPLMLSVAHQLVAGPRGLYGPFGRENPLVLIHAPLYYRAAALLACPLARCGMEPVDSARIAGRLISFAGLIATVLAAARLARLGGLPRRAGWWAAGLFASAPVLGGIPYAVRPDMAGVALQSWAVVLAVEALSGFRRGGWRLVAASVLFGLATCVKQHMVGAWAVTAAWSAAAWLRGREGLGIPVRVILPGVVLAALIYGGEWLVTDGRVWDAAFLAVARVGRVHAGSWDSVLILFIGVLGRSAGLIALLAVAAVAAAAAGGGVVRLLAAAIATLAVGLLLAALAQHATSATDTRESAQTAARMLISAGIAALAALPAALLSIRPSSRSLGLESTLWTYLAIELAIVTALSRQSTGAWLNYAIPATVFAAVLAARNLVRLADPQMPRWVALPVGLAALTLAVSCLSALAEERQNDREVDRLAEIIYDREARPRSSYFFTNRPGRNRINGRLELVYDDWLYPVFESGGLAEPRSHWLGILLGSRAPVTLVVAPSPRPTIDGTSVDLRRLGYRADVSVGPFYVWKK